MLNSILKIPKLVFSPFSSSAAVPEVKNNPAQSSAVVKNESRLFLPNREMRFSLREPDSLCRMAATLKNLINSVRLAGYDIIILCIGTDRSTGDALGPLTGTKLKSLNFHPDIYGTLEIPVHAANLAESVNFINNNYESPFIIAVDASLGNSENIGWFTLGSGAVKPGSALKKDLPAVGNAYITGVVNASGFMEHLVLQSTRLSLVIKMADTIAQGLSFALGKNEET